jgi:dCTP diphosphatase
MGEEEAIISEEKACRDISLKDLSVKLEEFAKARDWEKYHSPRNLLLAMVINLHIYHL